MGSNRNSFNNNEKKRGKAISELKKKKVIKKKRRVRKITLLILMTLIVGVIGLGIYGYSFLSGLSNESLPGGIDPIGKNPVNILVLGMDIGDAEQAEMQVGRRTDTMMVFNYNPITKKAQLISIPRDIYIEIDETSNKYGGKYWKMNVAYAIGGDEEVTNQIEDILDIQINYLVKIDYDAFRNIIDALGGIEMYIEQDMYYDDDSQDLHINFNAGETVLLDGKKAEEFFRWRGNNDGTASEKGDLGRIENQQKFIKKVIEKCISPSIVVKIPKILNTVSDSIDTNMDANQMLKYATQLAKTNKEDVVMRTIQGEPKYIQDESFIIYDREMNLDILESLQSGEVNSNTETDSGENIATPTINKADLKVMVLNGTKINGLAGGLQKELYDLSYGVVETGNSEPQDKSVIMTENKEIKDLLKAETGIKKFGKISDSDYKNYDVVIVLGKDYDLFGE